jgi:hypothetical protein
MIRRYVFSGVGSSGATSRYPPLHMTVDTNHPTLQPKHVGSSSAEDFTDKTLLLASLRPSDEPMHTPLVHPVLKSFESGALCLDSSSHQIDRQCPHLDRRFIRCYYLLLLHFFHSSDACRKWTVGSSDGASWLNPLHSVPSPLMLVSTLTSSYHRFIWWCLFPSFLCVFNLSLLVLNISSLIVLFFAMHILTYVWYVNFA